MRRWWFVVVVALIVWGIPASPPADAQVFPETGFAIDARFRTYWHVNGGLPLFGFPISPLVEELGEDGVLHLMQYFERARFEFHADAMPPDQVLLGRLGVLRLVTHGIDWQALPVSAPQDHCLFFPPTGHNLCAPFRTFWEQRGGLALFGLPLTPAQQEVSPTDGQPYLVQYFERARFEYHPEHRAEDQVQLGLLGSEQYHQSSAPPRSSQQVQEQVIALVNQARLDAGLHPLLMSPRLMQIADQYSTVLAEQGRIAHVGPDGSTAGERLTRGGYVWAAYAENLAAGMPTAEEVVSAWLRSAAHRANILTPTLTEIGAGWTHRDDDPAHFGDYWVLELAMPR